MPSTAFAQDATPPVPSQSSSKILPATKELLGVADVGLVCAAAYISTVTAIGIAACILTITAKACSKL